MPNNNQCQHFACIWHNPIYGVLIRAERSWRAAGDSVHHRLDAGERILIHCRGGLGRTGLVAGLILVERGILPEEAIRQIRAVRRHAIETSEQKDYVIHWGKRRSLQAEL